MTSEATPGRDEMLADELAELICDKIASEHIDLATHYTPPLARLSVYAKNDVEAIILDFFKSRLAAKPAEEGWQDISTAPMDTDVLLGWWRSWPERKWEMQSGLAGCTKGGWLHGQATHWQPLPAPPSTTGEPKL